MKFESLIRLVKSMTKSEKRNFKILANKTGRKNKLYVQLFDCIEQYGKVNKTKILQKIPKLKISQLPNLQNKLYTELLRSLREVNKDNHKEILAREQFDFAKVLYSKGEYQEALAYLQRAKKMGEEIQKSALIYLAIDFEKQIESQHITGSMSQRAVQLTNESDHLIQELHITNQLSNLSLLLYGRYLSMGFTRNYEEYIKLHDFFHNQLPVLEESELDFSQKLHLYQAYVWYYYMTHNFAYNYRYAKRWVTLFEIHPEMVEIETAAYLKGLHNVLSSLFAANKTRRFKEEFDKLLELDSTDHVHFNQNEISLLVLFKLLHGINYTFLSAEYKQGLSLIAQIEPIIKENLYGWDASRLIVFYYKIACVYFGNADYKSTIIWLHKITNNSFGNLKQDIQCYARILSLITHYEMKNDLLISYQIISTYRYLLKMREMGKVQRAVFMFLRKSSKVNRTELTPEFISLKIKLEIIAQDAFERRSFLYLDLLSWLDAKIKGITMVSAIQNNRVGPSDIKVKARL